MRAKVAIVAGGGGATGRATAMALAATGLTVVAVDRSEAGLRDLPDGVRPEVADTTDPAATTDVVDRIAAEVGPPDVLVNTIGAFGQGDVLSTTPEQLRLMLDVNLAPALWLSQAAARHMQRQGYGAIVHITARPGIEPSGGLAAYSVSKAALDMFALHLAHELDGTGVTVNSVRPGVVDTEMQTYMRSLPREQVGDSFFERFHGLHERGELISPVDSARFVVDVICSDGTGQVLDIRSTR